MHKDKPLRSFISESKSICTCISCYIILYELLLKKIGINQIKSNQDKEADKIEVFMRMTEYPHREEKENFVDSY